jgi:MYXO-CTERM domain-containing protein
MKRAFVVAAVVCATSWAGSARANGRFPYANHLVVDPSDSKHVVLRTTYGIVQTFDNGATWKWLCESSVGYGGKFDPAIAVTKSSRLLVGLFDGLTSSTDRGCDFARVGGALFEKQFVIDLVVEQKDPSHALAITSTGLGDAGFHVIIAESLDSGATWTQAGVDLPKDFNSETVEVAPSRPERIYASGIFGTPRQGVIEKSDDRGKTWERIPIELGTGGLAPYLAAVDPNDPDVVYVRIDGDASMSVHDRLLVSRDGAKTWTEIGNTTGDMLGFALSPDGTKLAYGGPLDGVFVASRTAPKPELVAPIAARCLTWSANGLYVCATEYPDDFTIGLSTDDGKTFKGIHNLANLSPLECAASTSTGRECPDDWAAVQSTIGIPLDDAGPDAGRDAGPNTFGPAEDGGCGCRVGRSAAAPFGLFALLALLIARRKK